MAPRSKVSQLPPEIKEWLDAELVRRGFSDYVQLAADLKLRGADISKSAVHNYASQFEKRLGQLKMAGEQARALVEASPDDEDNMGAALLRLTQEKCFALLMELDLKSDEIDVHKLFKNISELGKASVTVKKWQADAKVKAAAVADEIGKQAKSMGATDEVIKTWRDKVMGVVGK